MIKIIQDKTKIMHDIIVLKTVPKYKWWKYTKRKPAENCKYWNPHLQSESSANYAKILDFWQNLQDNLCWGVGLLLGTKFLPNGSN